MTVGLLEAAAKMVLYCFHERLWNRLDVGRQPVGHCAGDALDTAPPELRQGLE